RATQASPPRPYGCVSRLICQRIMSNQTHTQLTPHIERARKVLYYEQRGNHQDKIVRGGLELFAVHWADDVSSICKSAGLDLKPIHRFTEHLESYRQQDPMQRAASQVFGKAMYRFEIESGAFADGAYVV